MTTPIFKSLDEIRKSVSEQIEKSSTQEELVNGIIDLVSKYCFEVEMVKRRLAALEALERAKDKILSRYTVAAKSDLAEAVTIEAQEALAVDGLHELEYEAGGSAFRWTGPGNFSRFVAWVDRSAPIVVRLETSDGGDARNSKDLVVAIDGKPYRLNQDAFPNSYSSDPIPAFETGGPTEVVVYVPFLFRPSDNGDEDNRTLGIKFHRLELARVEG